MLGLVVMMAISSPQYVWTLFLRYFLHTAGGGAPAVQVTFSLLIVLQTLFSPAQGWLVDRFGPRRLVASGAALTGLGWVLSAHVSSLIPLYLTYGVLCGIGTGIVYVGIVGLMVRWFPDRRGFAIGVVAAGYGMGAMLTTFPIDAMLNAYGATGDADDVRPRSSAAIGLVAALGLREPRAGETPAPSRRRAARPRGRTAGDAEDADLLADVRDDDDDVDRRPDGHLEFRRLRARLRRRGRHGVRAWRRCRSR